jgi:hypothetical protein
MGKLNLSEDTIETLGMLAAGGAVFAICCGVVRIFMSL